MENLIRQKTKDEFVEDVAQAAVFTLLDCLGQHSDPDRFFEDIKEQVDGILDSIKGQSEWLSEQLND